MVTWVHLIFKEQLFFATPIFKWSNCMYKAHTLPVLYAGIIRWLLLVRHNNLIWSTSLCLSNTPAYTEAFAISATPPPNSWQVASVIIGTAGEAIPQSLQQWSSLNSDSSVRNSTYQHNSASCCLDGQLGHSKPHHLGLPRWPSQNVMKLHQNVP